MRWLSILLLLALTLSGCSGTPEATDDGGDPGDDGHDGGDGDHGGDDPSGGGDGAGGPNGTNQAPSAALNASALNGTAPLNVTFTLDGSDPDGDNLTWRLVVDGDEIAAGDSLPSQANHTFDVGNFSVTLTVSDGELESTASLNVTVGPAALPPVHLEFDIATGCIHCYTSVPQVTGFPTPDHCVGLNLDENHMDCAWIAVDPSWIGREFTTSGPSDVDVSFYSECSAGNEMESIADAGHDAGTILEGAGCIIVWDWDVHDGGTITMDIV